MQHEHTGIVQAVIQKHDQSWNDARRLYFVNKTYNNESVSWQAHCNSNVVECYTPLKIGQVDLAVLRGSWTSEGANPESLHPHQIPMSEKVPQ